MKRHVLIIAVAGSHLLAAGILLARMGAVLSVTGSPELEVGVVRAIWIQSAVLSVPVLLLLIGIVGLWRARPWGWWAAVAADALLVALVAGDLLAGGQRVDHGPVLVILAVLLLPLLIPQVRLLLTSAPDGPSS